MFVTAVVWIKKAAALTHRQTGRLDPKLADAIVASADEILRIHTTNTQRASGLISSFKQVAVNRSSEDVRELALAEYIEETLKSLRPRLKGTAHRITVDCDPALRIRSVPGALSQILTNLVLNSLIHGFEQLAEGSIAIAVVAAGATLALD